MKLGIEGLPGDAAGLHQIRHRDLIQVFMLGHGQQGLGDQFFGFVGHRLPSRDEVYF